jgi:hypothetical protein
MPPLPPLLASFSVLESFSVGSRGSPLCKFPPPPLCKFPPPPPLSNWPLALLFALSPPPPLTAPAHPPPLPRTLASRRLVHTLGAPRHA